MNANRLSVATAVSAGAPTAEIGELVTAVAAASLPERVVQEPALEEHRNEKSR